MKVIIKTFTDDVMKCKNGKTAHMALDNREIFRVGDGDTKNNSLSNTFSDCYGVDTLIKQAYETGKRKKPFEVEIIRVSQS